MRITEIFKLGKSQAEIDFVDIDPNADTPLFLDPFFLGLRTDAWSIEATKIVRNFFQHVVDRIRAGDEVNARKLFDFLREPNSTCLGVSSGAPEGRGVGDMDAAKIFDNLLKSKAIQTGLVQDIEDNVLFVDNFGKDKLSDMTTNILKKHLLIYTQEQCNLHGIPLSQNVPLGFFWSRQNEQWESEYADMLVVDNKPLLLVPKGIVSFSNQYTPDRYYNHFVLNFLQNENISLKTSLVKKYSDGTPYVTKKDLKEQHPQSKDFLREFTLKHPDVLEKFKAETQTESLTNSEISDVNIQKLCKALGEKLVSIPPGNAEASNFHKLVLGIIELLFYPSLIYPVKEAEIHDGRKRIDISFDNAAKDGIFFRFSNNMNLPCQFIFIECKNYSSDPANPELDQLAGRFSTNRGKVGFLICRTFEDKELFIQRCIDTYKDGRGLIVPLCDEDLIVLLDNHREYDHSFLDKFLSDLVRRIAMD